MQLLQIEVLEMEIESEQTFKNEMEVKLVVDIRYHDVTSMMHYDTTVLFIMYGYCHHHSHCYCGYTIVLHSCQACGRHTRDLAHSIISLHAIMSSSQSYLRVWPTRLHCQLKGNWGVA